MSVGQPSGWSIHHVELAMEPRGPGNGSVAEKLARQRCVMMLPETHNAVEAVHEAVGFGLWIACQ